MKQKNFRKRFLYWFDNRMSRGVGSMIFLLLTSTVIVVLGLSIVVALVEDESFFETFWNNFATAINAWLPESDAGSIGMIAVKSLSAIVGLLFTSILIGIFASAVEEKITALKKGRSEVLENGHTVILGFNQGDYSLISELILSKGDDKCSIVIADDIDKDEMEDLIHENLEIPKNVKIICRKADIGDPVSLNCCSFATCKNIVISPMEDDKSFRALLAAEKNLRTSGNNDATITCSVSSGHYAVPEGFGRNKTIQINTNEFIARILARSLVEPGLSWVYEEVFDYNGSEFYINSIPEITGKTFGQVMNTITGAVPVGIISDNGILLIPSENYIIAHNDRLLYFAAEKDDPSFDFSEKNINKYNFEISEKAFSNDDKVVIIGYNEAFPTIISEISGYTNNISLANFGEDNIAKITDCVKGFTNNNIVIDDKYYEKYEQYEELMMDASHIALLSGMSNDAESDDTDNMLKIIILSALRKKKGYKFNIAAEINKEINRTLVMKENTIDFIVANNMASLFMAQIAETPELYEFFRDLISSGGCELSLKSIIMNDTESSCISFRDMMLYSYSKGYILLGYIVTENGTIATHLNPLSDEMIQINNSIQLIVLEQE